MWRVFTFAVLMYVGLDFADPSMPGAVNFDPDQSVDAVRAQGVRANVSAPTVATLPPIARQIAELEQARRDIIPTVRTPLRLPRIAHARAVVADPSPAASDDH